MLRSVAACCSLLGASGWHRIRGSTVHMDPNGFNWSCTSIFRLFQVGYSKVGPDHLVDAVPGKPWSLSDFFACLREYEVPVLASLQLSTGTTYTPVGGRPWSIRCYILCFFPRLGGIQCPQLEVCQWVFPLGLRPAIWKLPVSHGNKTLTQSSLLQHKMALILLRLLRTSKVSYISP